MKTRRSIVRQETHVFAFATKGTGTNEENRLRGLLERCDARFLAYDKSAKRKSFFDVLRKVYLHRPALLVMEGTGLAGGAVCLLARLLWGQRYVFSSGDAVGPFVGGIIPALSPIFGLYERLLCRCSAGFIGWTPYLCGRALTFGAPRAITAAGWCDQRRSREQLATAREKIRSELGIPQGAIVFGIVGALAWNRHHEYCYGWELVQAALISRQDCYVLIVGGGSGLIHLREAAGDRLGRNIFLPGPVAAEQAIDYMSAMDVGSLPQSVDRVGSFRYTTKISEYIAAELPIVTGQIPLAYDLAGGWSWRLPGDSPWSSQYIKALAALMSDITPAEIAGRCAMLPGDLPLFERVRQTAAVTEFVQDLLAAVPLRRDDAIRPGTPVSPGTLASRV